MHPLEWAYVIFLLLLAFEAFKWQMTLSVCCNQKFPLVYRICYKGTLKKDNVRVWGKCYHICLAKLSLQWEVLLIINDGKWGILLICDGTSKPPCLEKKKKKSKQPMIDNQTCLLMRAYSWNMLTNLLQLFLLPLIVKAL